MNADNSPANAADTPPPASNPPEDLTALHQEAQTLRQEIATLKSTQTTLLQQQLREVQTTVEKLATEQLQQLTERKQKLEVTIDQLERRQARLEAEMRQSFAGASQDMAIRVQGFRDYLINSLQELANAAEQIQLATHPNPLLETSAPRATSPAAEPANPLVEIVPPQTPHFATQSFREEALEIRDLLDQYRNMPNYYGPPWQLRRTFEPIHAERVSTWFFTFGGRGALRALGSRLQNILVASAVISILNHLYGNRVRALILANSPERLGDWRRGLQDCLGISRMDFSPDRGVALFESPEPLAQKADRLVKEDQIPLILLDDGEAEVSLSVLQFPLWLAFAPEPQLRRERSGNFDWFE
ncbi:DUF3086 domain-containing protein [Synechococcales cyanobacterium C]|uniref:DUF3086 domain-containing protein n=2 Tax=Petrachloros TaxID=2918834 RepID=A0A8K2A001_9CYAN|nr:DUF3086 domain-containing protein [Petrachloros mirabilis ULC683]